MRGCSTAIQSVSDTSRVQLLPRGVEEPDQVPRRLMAGEGELDLARDPAHELAELLARGRILARALEPRADLADAPDVERADERLDLLPLGLGSAGPHARLREPPYRPRG